MQKRINIALFTLLLFCCACGREKAGEGGIEKNVEVWTRLADDHGFAMQLGRYASGRASDQRLKDYGRDMMTYHETVLAAVKQQAMLRQISLRDTLAAKDVQRIAVLSREAGNYFDSSYMDIMIEREKALMSSYEKIAGSGTDSIWRQFARDQKDSIDRQLQRIIRIKDSINVRKE